MSKEQDKADGTQFLKKAMVEDSETRSPIQGPVLDETPLFEFIQKNHDEAIDKMWGVFLDEKHMVLGIEPLAFGEGAKPSVFNTASLFHYYSVFMAKRFILLSYRYNALDDPAPTDADHTLISRLRTQAEIMNGADLSNYAIFTSSHYWSMRQQNGTACHCGSQHYFPKDGEV